jgi:hypothetical protein
MRHGSLLPAILLTTLALFLTSCSRSPVAPSVDTSAIRGAGNTAVSVDPTDVPPSDGGTPLTRVQTLTASEEGVLVVGRWTLYVRKNSLKMPATITMHVVDPEAMEVDFDVQPAAANNFSQTVFLTANMSDVGGFDYSAGGLLSWNGSAWTKATYSSHQNQQNVVGRFSSLGNTMVSYNVSGK